MRPHDLLAPLPPTPHRHSQPITPQPPPVTPPAAAATQPAAVTPLPRTTPHSAACLSAGLIIDARSKGNLARLLNSSCNPNCETQKWHDASNSEVRCDAECLPTLLGQPCSAC